MRTSEKGRQFIKGWEQLRLRRYKCPAGVWTNGWGHTGKDVTESTPDITVEQAERNLTNDLVTPELAVRNYVTVPLTQGQFDALVSLIMNVGPGRAAKPGQPGRDGIITLANGRPSTLLRKLNEGDYRGAAMQFHAWNRAGGAILNGLVKRRAGEYDMFTGEA